MAAHYGETGVETLTAARGAPLGLKREDSSETSCASGVLAAGSGPIRDR
jgi:hypothetical protein